jgi:WD40 repeat protein
MKRLTPLILILSLIGLTACQIQSTYLPTPTKTPYGGVQAGAQSTSLPTAIPTEAATLPPEPTTAPAADAASTAAPAPEMITVDNASQIASSRLVSLDNPTDLAWSPDGSLLAVLAESGLSLFDGSDLTAAPRLIDPGTGGGSDLIILAGYDKTIRLVDVVSGEVETLLDGVNANTVAINPTGTMLAIGDSAGKVHLLDYPSGQIMQQLSIGWAIQTVAFSPDGTILNSGGDDGMVWMWDVVNMQLLNKYDYIGEVWTIDFSPDGIFFATGSADNSVRLWDVLWSGTRREVTFEEHGNDVLSIDFNPDGTIIASGGADGFLYLWDVVIGGSLVHFQAAPSGEVVSVAFSPDGTTLATVNSNGPVDLWRLP